MTGTIESSNAGSGPIKSIRDKEPVTNDLDSSVNMLARDRRRGEDRAWRKRRQQAKF